MNVEKLQRELKKRNIDFVILYSNDEKIDSNLIYFSKYAGEGFLIVHKTMNPFIISNTRDFSIAKQTKIKTYKREKNRTVVDIIKDIIKNYKTIGIDKENMDVSSFESFKKILKGKYINISKLCKKIRKKKTKEELKNIFSACKITDEIFKKTIDNFNFQTENELRLFIEFEIKKRGCEISFPPIVASGKNSSIPHYVGDSKIEKGFLLLDFGAKYNGYCSDMTRMLYIGRPTPTEIQNYNFVLNIQKDILKNVILNKEFSELCKEVRQEFGNKEKYFIHSLGHGLGLDIHESPIININSKEKIEESVPFTIEPGIYYPNKYGIRVEDTVVFQNKKLNVITKCSKKLKIIK